MLPNYLHNDDIGRSIDHFYIKSLWLSVAKKTSRATERRKGKERTTEKFHHFVKDQYPFLQFIYPLIKAKISITTSEVDMASVEPEPGQGFLEALWLQHHQAQSR